MYRIQSKDNIKAKLSYKERKENAERCLIYDKVLPLFLL